MKKDILIIGVANKNLIEKYIRLLADKGRYKKSVITLVTTSKDTFSNVDYHIRLNGSHIDKKDIIRKIDPDLCITVQSNLLIDEYFNVYQFLKKNGIKSTLVVSEDRNVVRKLNLSRVSKYEMCFTEFFSKLLKKLSITLSSS